MTTVLMISPFPLYPVNHGSIVRLVEKARFLCKNGFHVHLVGNRIGRVESVVGRVGSRVDDRDGLEIVRGLTGAEVYTYSGNLVRSAVLRAFRVIDGRLGMNIPNPTFVWWNPLMRRDIERIVRRIRPDIVQSEFAFFGHQLLGIAEKRGIPVVLDQHNIEHFRLVQQGVFGARQAGKLLESERDTCNSVAYVTTVSEQDRRRLVRIGVRTPIEVVPNGVDYDRYQVDVTLRRSMRSRYGIREHDTVLVFHGTLSYPPNLDASRSLVTDIFPRLATRYHNLKLLLIGPGYQANAISGGVIQLAAKGISCFNGLPEHLSMGDIGVVPLAAGFGSRLKILEYLALGIPTVSTRIGAEGLPVVDGQEILIAEDAKDDFLEKVTRLLDDKQLQDNLRRNGRKLARDRLDWNVVLSKYLCIYDQLISRKRQ